MSTYSRPEPKKAFVTLLSSSSYLPGILVLNQSLIDVKAKYPLVVLILEGPRGTEGAVGLSDEEKDVLKRKGAEVRKVKWLEPEGSNYKKHYLTKDMTDNRFLDTWTKLRVWELEEYERLVYIDADTLVLQNMDELLDSDDNKTYNVLPGKDWVAAASACTCNPRKLKHYPISWRPENCAHTYANFTTPISISSLSSSSSVPTDSTIPQAPPLNSETTQTFRTINSGLFVFSPSLKTFEEIKKDLNEKEEVRSYGFPDQDFISRFFAGRVNLLGYHYNALKTLRSCHKNIWRDEDVKMVHYILDKPWQKRIHIDHSKDGKEGVEIEKRVRMEENQVTHGWWWQAYDHLISNWDPSDYSGRELVKRVVDALAKE